MKKLFGKKLKSFFSLAITLTLLLTVLLPAEAVFAATPTGVNGRVLPVSKTGDSSDWVEIARYGDFSLILRKDVLPLGWVNFPVSGMNNSYQVSNARNVVNNWFKNTLNNSARLRDFTVKNTALSNIGSFANTGSGYSNPTSTAARTGDDVAFLLSFSEAAQFCSMQYATSTSSWAQSSAIAKANFGKLTPLPTMPVQYDFWWLRSPGSSSTNVCSVGTHNMAMVSTVWCSSALAQAGATYVYIRPALWVGSDIFEEKHPIVVKYYKDDLSAGNLINQVSLPSATVGSAITGVDLTLFAPSGYVTPGARSGATVVAAGTNIVNVLYTKPVTPKYATYVYYYKDYVGGEFLGFETLPEAPVGSLITGVNATIHVPGGGYIVPGTISGDTTVKSPFSTVYVVYTKPAAPKYPTYVYYYKDYVGGEFLGFETLPEAEAGKPVTGVNAAIYAPGGGYTVPGTISGDTLVRSPFSVVYVVFTKPVAPRYPVFVYYYKDYVGGEFLGFETLPDAEAGMPITGVNTAIYAPSGYIVPGTISGDVVAKSPYSILFVVYTKPQLQQYIITFNANGGTGFMPPAIVTANSSYLVPNSTFDKFAFVFDSWNTQPDGNGTTYLPNNPMTPTSNITLYAIWLPIW